VVVVVVVQLNTEAQEEEEEGEDQGRSFVACHMLDRSLKVPSRNETRLSMGPTSTTTTNVTYARAGDPSDA
jgi:hypothetical protein